MGEVVPLNIKPKTISGSKRNVSWVITYVPAFKHWSWEVTVTLKPEVFKGTSKTQAEAHKEVDTYLKTMA